MHCNQHIFKYAHTLKQPDVLKSSGYSQLGYLIRCKNLDILIFSIVFALIESLHFTLRAVFHDDFSVKLNRSVGRCIHSGDNIESCRLAGSVWTYKPDYLTFVYLKAQIIYGHNTSELHGYVGNTQYIFLTHFIVPPSLYLCLSCDFFLKFFSFR